MYTEGAYRIEGKCSDDECTEGEQVGRDAVDVKPEEVKHHLWGDT